MPGDFTISNYARPHTTRFYQWKKVPTAKVGKWVAVSRLIFASQYSERNNFSILYFFNLTVIDLERYSFFRLETWIIYDRFKPEDTFNLEAVSKMKALGKSRKVDRNVSLYFLAILRRNNTTRNWSRRYGSSLIKDRGSPAQANRGKRVEALHKRSGNQVRGH